jgi:hypothetical protein
MWVLKYHDIFLAGWNVVVKEIKDTIEQCRSRITELKTEETAFQKYNNFEIYECVLQESEE